MFCLALPDEPLQLLCLQFFSKLRIEDDPEPDPVDEILLQFSALNIITKKRPTRRAQSKHTHTQRRENRRENRADGRREAVLEISKEVQKINKRKKRKNRKQDESQKEPEVIIIDDDEEPEVIVIDDDEETDVNNLQVVQGTFNARNWREVLFGPVIPNESSDREQLIKSINHFFGAIPDSSRVVKYRGKEIAAGSHCLKQAPKNWHAQNLNKKFRLASKNIGFSGIGASRDLIEGIIRELINTHKNVSLWCLQEAKMCENLPVNVSKGINEPMFFLKDQYQDLTGFVVEKGMRNAKVLKLHQEGRVTVLNHDSLPFVVFNVYFQTGKPRKQLDQALCLKEGIEAAYLRNMPLAVCGDFNCVVDLKKDVIEHSNKTEAQKKKSYSGQKAIMDCLLEIFHTFQLFDLFRYHNPNLIAATNHPHNQKHAERRIDRIVCHRFMVDDYLYEVLQENKRISTHDIILMVQANDPNMITNERQLLCSM